jgi:type I restriction-modification system DNA methylase subunit
MAKPEPEILAHLEWIGFVRPTGLVVSAPALVRAGAILDRRDAEGQRLLRDCVEERTFPGEQEPTPWVPDFQAFAESVLGWTFSPAGYAGTPENTIPTELELPLPDYGETLRPDFAVREPEPENGASAWQLLVRVLQPGEDFDRVVRGNGQLEASAHGRMERFLRQTGVSAGLLFNGRALRLLSAQRGESSGWLDFRVADMVQTAGRPISTAMRLLLGQPRLLSLPRHQRLAALLNQSRKFQNEVSERLAEQVLHALYEILRGFQAAHDASGGELLHRPLAEHPDEVYRALLTVILRLVFLLYAEERGMLPEDETFIRYYSLVGLYERLREDAALYPDTMDQRYGAWAQLLALFRMIHDGADCGSMHIPKRHGVLFDPNRFPFLEGRQAVEARQIYDRIEAPLVSDGTIYRALEKLLVLDGERISYRALDVEQIGSVYETMMGYRLETASGRSVAIKAEKTGGAPTTIDLDELLAKPAAGRGNELKDRTQRKPTDSMKSALSEAKTIEDLHAALLPVIDVAATPDLVPKGAMVLQPSEERRRSGSHYTPRTLTEPIVRTALEPILGRLRGPDGRPPLPQQILDLKVLDPAMGSGAFLVEACRFLGDALIEAWNVHSQKPKIPPDEDEVVFARRLIAQRCLYGVDRNPVAVDLAKVSLWLVTLAKQHPLTFLDHALRHGDSLVGLSREQIEAFHWRGDVPVFQAGFEMMHVREHMAKVAELRESIRDADETVSDEDLRTLWDKTQFELSKVRLFGDVVLAAFFEGKKAKERERKRGEYANAVVNGKAEDYRGRLAELRHSEQPFAPFHWEIEFPEAFGRENGGFDAIIGNPPFAGVTTLSRSNDPSYTDWLRTVWPDSGGKCDLVAFFFRQSFKLLRSDGILELIATNTIAQGDTRESGLASICRSGGTIFSVRRRIKWPGSSAVTVSVIAIAKGVITWPKAIDGKVVDQITAFLFTKGGNELPKRLSPAITGVTKGVVPYGLGFVIDSERDECIRPEELAIVLSREPDSRQLIFDYFGGDEFNSSPTLTPSKQIVNFGDMTLEQASQFPALLGLIREKVKPMRDALTDQSGADALKEYWWKYQYSARELYAKLGSLRRTLAVARVTKHMSLAFLPTGMVFDEMLVVFPTDRWEAFTVLQSRIHEVWARFFSSTLEDRLRYTPTACFETFPFPANWNGKPSLEKAGEAYHEYRNELMVRNNEGLTGTYNRFHDPDEHNPGVIRLRELHAAMDRDVLDAYGWADIKTDCEFFLDYEDEDDWGNKKKPWRHRWPDEIRDEVLARLLELNAERAEEESRSGSAAAMKPVNRVARASVLKAHETEDLFS